MTQRQMPPTGERPLPSRQQRLPEQIARHQWDGYYHRDVVYPGGVGRYQREIS
ncbi:MAG: hypothetical protein J2P36_22180 [Ktedonobacteraceae bacterium]|nr:hypothetical protein [Ktedonobacteraceae bacterium]